MISLKFNQCNYDIFISHFTNIYPKCIFIRVIFFFFLETNFRLSILCLIFLLSAPDLKTYCLFSMTYSDLAFWLFYECNNNQLIIFSYAFYLSSLPYHSTNAWFNPVVPINEGRFERVSLPFKRTLVSPKALSCVPWCFGSSSMIFLFSSVPKYVLLQITLLFTTVSIENPLGLTMKA